MPAADNANQSQRTTIPAGSPSLNRAEYIRLWLARGLLIVAGTLAYATAIDAPFLFDDVASILRNPSIRHLESLGAVLNPPAGGEGVTGRPMVNLSLALNYALSGESPVGYHVFNVLCHCVCGVLLFGLVRRTFLLPRWRLRFGAASARIAFFAALIWGLHPLQTESVTCVIQRTEGLLALFYLSTFYGFVRSVGRGAGVRGGWLVGSVIACALGMATKEVMVSAPLLVWFFDGIFVSTGFVAALRARKSYYGALAVTWLLLAVLVLGMGGSRGSAAGFGLGVPWWTYALKQCSAIVSYLGLSLWPSPLVLDYGTDVIWEVGQVWRQGLVLLALLGLGGWLFFRRSAWGFLFAFFFAVLAPSSSVVPLITQTMAEHRMYLPLAAVSVGLVVLGELLVGRRVAHVAFLMAVALGVLTVARNILYRTELTIWWDTIVRAPTNPRAITNFGNALLNTGRASLAVDYYQRSLGLKPSSAETQANLAGGLIHLGRYAEAARHAEAALRLAPGHPVAHNNLAGAFLRTGKMQEALVHARAALAVLPDLVEGQVTLGLALAETGALPEASEVFQRVLRAKPKLPDAYFGLGCVLLRQGKFGDAEQNFRTALMLRPNYGEASDALGNLCLQTQRIDEAITHYEAAVRSKPDWIQARANLGAALLRQGKNAEALTYLAAAARELPDDGDIRTNLGTALLLSGRAADAAEEYRAALRAGVDGAAVHRNLAIALKDMGHPDEALKHFALALQKDPNLLHVYLDMGLTSLGAGDAAQAIAHFQAALARRPQWPDASHLLGLALARAGRTPEAIARLEEAVKIAPDFKPAVELLRQLRSAGK